MLRFPVVHAIEIGLGPSVLVVINFVLSVRTAHCDCSKTLFYRTKNATTNNDTKYTVEANAIDVYTNTLFFG